MHIPRALGRVQAWLVNGFLANQAEFGLINLAKTTDTGSHASVPIYPGSHISIVEKLQLIQGRST